MFSTAHVKTFLMSYIFTRDGEEHEDITEIEAYSMSQAQYFAQELCNEQGWTLVSLEMTVERTA